MIRFMLDALQKGNLKINQSPSHTFKRKSSNVVLRVKKNDSNNETHETFPYEKTVHGSSSLSVSIRKHE